ncbi:hypothetical protein [Streptomyces sp. NPDC047070]|uniref:hypothetical protein n=1 Tax=Streptomyces sp. NPDC047070 TaxID=3154923 RepID=UPI003455AB62
MSDRKSAVVLPGRLARLPRDRHGRLVPWFVGYVDGVPDHRVIRPGGVPEAVRFRLCFLCGGQLGAYSSFVVGPMCVINRVAAEPPAHRTCAEYAVQACPFLITPNMRRRPDLPEGSIEPEGMQKNNPGTGVVWTTRSWEQMRQRQLITFGDPTEVTWWTEGRRATRDEASTALAEGLGRLRVAAWEEDPSPRVQENLTRQYDAALVHLPGAAA